MKKTNQGIQLKYKCYDPYYDREINYDPNIGEMIGEWEDLDNPTYEEWQLQLPGSLNFITKPDGDIACFYRYEYYAINDDTPVAIFFERIEKYNVVPLQTYQLDNSCTINNVYGWTFTDIKNTFLGYEQNRAKWKAREFVRTCM